MNVLFLSLSPENERTCRPVSVSLLSSSWLVDSFKKKRFQKFHPASIVFRLIKDTQFVRDILTMANQSCGVCLLGQMSLDLGSPPCNLSVFAFLMGANTKLSNDLKPITKPASHSFSNLPLPKVLDNLPPHYYRYLCADGLRLSRFFHIMSGFLPRPCITVVHFNGRSKLHPVLFLQF